MILIVVFKTPSPTLRRFAGEGEASAALGTPSPAKRGRAGEGVFASYRTEPRIDGFIVYPVWDTFHLRKYRSSHEIAPKNVAEKTEPTTIVA